jgi:hypothetical protein
MFFEHIQKMLGTQTADFCRDVGGKFVLWKLLSFIIQVRIFIRKVRGKRSRTLIFQPEIPVCSCWDGVMAADSPHPGARRTTAQPLKQFFKLSGRAFGPEFHIAVLGIPHPSGQPQAASFAYAGITKPNPLYPPLNQGGES